MAFPYRAMRPIRHGQMPATTFDVIRGEQVVGRVYESPSGWCSAQYRTVSGKFQPVGQGRCHTNKLAAAKEVTACHLVGLFHWEEQSDAIGTAAKLDRIRAELADVLKVQGYDNGTRAAAQAILA